VTVADYLGRRGEIPVGLQRKSLDRSIRLATSVEHLSAAIGYHFHVTYAYYSLVERLIRELGERMSRLQTIAELMDRRFQSAMRILISIAVRLESLLQ
jgi:uncharacterized membrane-anchored protein